MAQNDGGPAFPHPQCDDPGASLRDLFAAAALAGMLATPNREGFYRDYADDAWKHADAMLRAREVEP